MDRIHPPKHIFVNNRHLRKSKTKTRSNLRITKIRPIPVLETDRTEQKAHFLFKSLPTRFSFINAKHQ